MADKKALQALFELNLTHCVPACDVSQLDSNFVEIVTLAQKMAGQQFVVTSAFRSLEWEKSKGRKGTSSHVKGLAVDVSAQDSYSRFRIVAAAILAGIPRIGIGKTFVHLDCDLKKAHPIIFHYYDPQNT